MVAEEGFTLAEFRAAHGLTAAQWARHVEAGTAPAVTVIGRAKIITAEVARAWEEAEAQRFAEGIAFWDPRNPDESVDAAG